jgi:N-glycosylase/DNA lyase
MANLISEIENLKADPAVSGLVGQRIREFEAMGRGDEKAWFRELCFCLLTANTSARMGMCTIDAIGERLLSSDEKTLAEALKACKYRFYNRRAHFIVMARRLVPFLKKEIQGRGEKDAREWLADTVKGIGLKEASHFLRNVGYKNLAILDKHVLSVLFEHGLLEGVPKSLVKERYLGIEGLLDGICKKTGLSQAELDMYLWYMETGEVLK